MSTFDRDDVVEVFDYLDTLREGGTTNMFGAARWVHHDFDYDMAESRKLLALWMDTFDPSLSPEERADQALAEKAG